MELVIFPTAQHTGADCEDRPDSKEHVHRNEALGVRALLARLRRVVPERASEEGARSATVWREMKSVNTLT